MKSLLLLLLPLALAPACAGGFFDDFDGEDLGPHWRFGNPKGGMIYSVHDSLLEVYGVTGFGNGEWIYASIAPYGDFDLRGTVGWRLVCDLAMIPGMVSSEAWLSCVSK